jgi:hypothetical protein
MRTASCYPSSDEINSLLEKSGDVQTIALLREDRDALQRRVEELETELDRLR